MEIFDINVFPSNPGSATYVAEVAAAVPMIASNLEVTHENPSDAFSEETIDALAAVLRDALAERTRPRQLDPMWRLEHARVARLAVSELIAEPIEYFREALLQALYFSEEHYQTLAQRRQVPPDEMEEILFMEEFGIALVRRTIGGVVIDPLPALAALRGDPLFETMRGVCLGTLQSYDSTRFHFQDIQTPGRLRAMVQHVEELLDSDVTAFREALRENASNGTGADIEHTRCWMADVLAEMLGMNHNRLNDLILQHPAYTGSIPNPFNNMTMRSARFLGDEEEVESMVEAFTQIVQSARANLNRDAAEIVRGLMSLRIYASKGLQKFNPLLVGLGGIAEQHGFSMRGKRVASCLNDLVQGNGAVGKFDLIEGVDGNELSRFYLTTIAVGPNYSSDHKADEWSARRRMMGYRLNGGRCSAATIPDTVFVYDGNWSDKSVRKLVLAGWDHVCSVRQFSHVIESL